MRTSAVILTFLLTSIASADEGFVPLFNGKTLEGWKERQVKAGQEGRWHVSDGILKAKPGSGWLGTEKVYANFVLRVEWKIVENGNSGVFIRVPTTEFKGSPSDAGFEIQILDDHASKYNVNTNPH